MNEIESDLVNFSHSRTFEDLFLTGGTNTSSENCGGIITEVLSSSPEIDEHYASPDTTHYSLLADLPTFSGVADDVSVFGFPVIVDDSMETTDDVLLQEGSVLAEDDVHQNTAATDGDTQTIKQPKKRKAKKHIVKSSSSGSSDDDLQPSTKKKRTSVGAKRKRPQTADEDDEQLDRLNQIPTNELTEDDKKLKKKLRNRQSARRSRENKKQELQVAQELNAQLTNTCTKLREEITELKSHIQQLESENEKLKQQLTTPPEPRVKEEDDFLMQDESATSFGVTGAKTITFLFLFCIGFFCFTLFPSSGGNIAVDHMVNSSSALISKYEFLQSQPSTPYTPTVRHQGVRLLQAATDSKVEKEIINENHSQETLESETDFNGDSMIKRRVYFPPSVRSHFVSSKLTTTSLNNELVPVPDQYIPRDFSLQNSKQISAIPSALSSDSSSLYMYNQMKDKKLDQGFTYQLPGDSDEDQAIRLLCPYIYPILHKHRAKNSMDDSNVFNNMKDKGCIKLVVPIQTMEHEPTSRTVKKVVRMAEITAKDITFDEMYLELDVNTK